MYNAFISYSHAADGKLAPALQIALEKIAKPWYKIRNLNVFRDESSLAVSPHLWSNIKEALLLSEYLIYMASPASKSSKWVIKEMEYWLENKSIETLLIVLTDGEINWDSEHKVYLNNATNSLPEILQGKLKEELFYIDLRSARTESDISLNNPIFKKEVLKLAAHLHGMQPKDLASEEVFAFRKMKKIRNTVITLLVFLVCITGISAWLANAKAKEAKFNLKKAEINAKMANQERDSAIAARNMAANNARISRLERDTANEERNNALYQKQIAIMERNRAEANYLWSQSKTMANSDPTIALKLAAQASLLVNDEEIERDLKNIYYSNSFYKKVTSVALLKI